MKKVLITAASALVITATAATAQTVTLSGELTATLSYDGSGNQFQGPNVGAGSDDELLLKYSNSNMGWEYGFEANLLNGLQYPIITVGNEELGELEIQEDYVEWSKRVMSDTLLIRVGFQPSDLENFTLNLWGEAYSFEYDFEFQNDSQRSFHGDIWWPLLGLNVGLSVAGELHDTSAGQLAYAVEIGGDVADIEAYAGIDSNGQAYLETGLNSFLAGTNLSDGDFFNDIYLGYENDISEFSTLSAYVYFDGSSTSAEASFALKF